MADSDEPKIENSTDVDDPELDNLLDSALEDFSRPAPSAARKTVASTTDGKDHETKTDLENKSKNSPSKVPQENSHDDLLDGVADDAAKQFEDAMKDLMGNDPQLIQQLDQLVQAAGNITGSADSHQAFSETLAQTIGSLSENTENLQQETNFSEDELLRAMSGMGLGSGGDTGAMGDEMLPMMQTMMKGLLSKEVLYPSLKEISTKYPDWLTENKDQITENDYTRYNKQLNLMQRICDEFDKEKDTDSEATKNDRFQSVMNMMQEMQGCGQPPKEIVGEMAPGLEFNEDGSPKLPGNMEQCVIM